LSEVVKIGTVKQFPKGHMKKVAVDGKEILVANVEGKLYAIGNRCTHLNAELSHGILEGLTVTCPLHDGTFDLVTGAARYLPYGITELKPVPVYEVQVKGKGVYVKPKGK
jgi:nitrite reductase/ring-hydroxylating ferredoxin subunit